MQVAKWGNSLAVRIPADVARALNLKVGDDIELRTVDEGVLAVVTEAQRRAAALAVITSLSRPFPPGFRFDREEANAR